MTSHVGLMVVFAFFVSLVFSVIAKDAPRDQLRLGLKLFGGFVGTGIVAAWVMLLFPL